ncbi:MAG TPA: tripartite tricarboxylate transporter substrate binding protein [Burkholderiales bacterium]|nr:tripartite tricarboxylate transporter substrate binding protein [Burkholderiales bacterium]
MKRLVAALVATLIAGTAHAQNFPAHALRLVVAFPAGGPIDIVARLMTPRLTDVLGQQVIVDNRGGANGIIGTDFVAKSPPDGYTMVLASPGAVAISPAVYPKMPYETLRDFAPVTLVSTTPELLVVHPSVPAKSVKELVALAKAHPGQLNIASTGSGGLPHFALELLKAVTGTQMVHVPYNGAAPAVAALLGGQVQGLFADLPVLLPHVQSGKLRALVVASPKRAPLLPDLPTTHEQGIQAVEAVNWYGILVAAKTPAEIVGRLNEAFVKTLADPGVREKMAGRGADPVGSKPAEFAAYLKQDMDRWARLAQTVTIKVD